jgi:hypothetical protein
VEELKLRMQVLETFAAHELSDHRQRASAISACLAQLNLITQSAPLAARGAAHAASPPAICAGEPFSAYCCSVLSVFFFSVFFLRCCCRQKHWSAHLQGALPGLRSVGGLWCGVQCSGHLRVWWHAALSYWCMRVDAALRYW